MWSSLNAVYPVCVYLFTSNCCDARVCIQLVRSNHCCLLKPIRNIAQYYHYCFQTIGTNLFRLILGNNKGILFEKKYFAKAALVFNNRLNKKQTFGS